MFSTTRTNRNVKTIINKQTGFKYEKVTLKFGGPLEPAFSKVEVYDENDRKVSGKTIFLKSNKVMECDLDENLPPGMYTVKIKCMSLDGHSIKEEYTFIIE